VVADDAEPLPKVTLAHLRRADRMCAFRLRQEHLNHYGNRGATMRFALAGRIEADVRLAHTELTAPAPSRFRPGDDLEPEAAAVYRAATRWYAELFADRPARALDEDARESEVPALGIRLVGPAGIALEDAAGEPELRLLRLADRAALPPALQDAPAVRFALLRTRDRFGDRPLRVSVADLLHGTLVSERIDVEAVAPELEDWLGERVEVIRARLGDPRPHRSTECGWCGFVAACGAHR
jgi:hypothetical protein